VLAVSRFLFNYFSSVGGENMSKRREASGKGEMTVEEAGHKGGQKVRKLIQEGKKYEQQR
jgi:hypothetical protein